ncbi:hypothetical protein HJD18_11175 [Thermoleophilia bacterium SCSIO 60948]|nr:hypothetical protein HJD18_11175 [Thermoleophilia bacterium SCSIO 60948]
MPRYLEPTAPIAAAAVLTGDPKRAMELATAATDRPLMSNLARGLWGYHGTTPSGAELSVHSTGIGGPSTALVLRELHGHGIRRAIRVGTATGLDPSLELGSVHPVFEALSNDGTSAVLRVLRSAHEDGPVEISGPSDVAEPSANPGLTSALTSRLRANAIRISSHDLPWEMLSSGLDQLSGRDPEATDLSTAAFFAQADVLGVEAAAIVVITAGPAGEASLEEADAACLAAGRVAAELLTGPLGHSSTI